MLRVLTVLVLAVLSASSAFGQTQDPHAGMHHPAAAPGWTCMQDAVVFGLFNHQGSPRGETEFKAPNWWMGMAQRPLGGGTFTVNLMLGLDPLTVGHQHPHDFLMQAAALWRRPFANGVVLTLAGAPVGEPGLGPIAFMHRSSAMENPMSSARPSACETPHGRHDDDAAGHVGPG